MPPLLGYPALPIDLVSDFIPIAGQLDDVILVSLALRRISRADRERVELHWPASRAHRSSFCSR